MKNLLLATWAILIAISANAQPPFVLSTNVYRVPYANGTDVHVSRDHRIHTPSGRYDMSGRNNGSSCTSNYPIVAAAEGIVRRIVDNHNVSPPDCDPNCADFNNYVWIEHANGEWSKYSHMKQNSTSVTAGLNVGDQVCAGTLLGYECEVGQASGPHLHFEVRVPNNPANVQISTAGGFMSDAAHVIPVINSIGLHYFNANYDITASGSTACANNNLQLNLPFAINNDGVRIYLASSTVQTLAGISIIYNNGSNGMFQAGGSVTLSPGFQAMPGSNFHARIGNCSTTGMAGGCQ
ncbi:MAG TPA: M23 family metallopeptidase [Ferruginibacter sp.]|nr:M23 family metallopeptidase [Ferruginibacter sp.]HRE64423.1 M23 family metallopeptidase [Ferruginibacter sp.]